MDNESAMPGSVPVCGADGGIGMTVLAGMLPFGVQALVDFDF